MAYDDLLSRYSRTYPDVDSLIHLHTEKEDYRLRSTEGDEKIEFILLREKRDRVPDSTELPAAEMEVLDTEGQATYIIHRMLQNSAIKRGVVLFVLLLAIFTITGLIVMAVALGILPPYDDMTSTIFAVSITGGCVPLLCFIGSRASANADRTTFRLRENLPEVFRAIAEVQEHDYKKQSFLRRADALERLQ